MVNASIGGSDEVAFGSTLRLSIARLDPSSATSSSIPTLTSTTKHTLRAFGAHARGRAVAVLTMHAPASVPDPTPSASEFRVLARAQCGVHVSANSPVYFDLILERGLGADGLKVPHDRGEGWPRGRSVAAT